MKEKLSGYTLVELLISIFILIVIFTVGTASYRSFSRRKAVEEVVRLVRADLNLVRTWAVSGKKPTVTPLCTGALVNYTLVFTSSNPLTYRIEARCPEHKELVTKSVAIPTGTTVSMPSEISFAALTGASSPNTITISNSFATHTITVASTGEIN